MALTIRAGVATLWLMSATGRFEALVGPGAITNPKAPET